MFNKKFFIENTKTLFYALIIAVIIRSFLIQPFYIPSSSMEPNLWVGDRLFVTKTSNGYSKHSFPFSPPILSGRIFNKVPQINAISKEKIKEWINRALLKAEQNKINGKAVTPFLIKEINNYSNNKTLKANVSLIINNADLAGKIAKNFYS